MQRSRQKGGKLRAVDAIAQGGLGCVQCVQPIDEVFNQVGEVVRAPVGQGVLEMIPHALIRIEFRRIGGKAFQVQAREKTTQISDWLSPVCVEVVPDHDDVAPKVTQEVTQKLTDLALLDVLDMQAPVEANRLRCGLTDSPEMAETLSRRCQCRITGVLPRGAQVLRTLGVS